MTNAKTHGGPTLSLELTQMKLPTIVEVKEFIDEYLGRCAKTNSRIKRKLVVSKNIPHFFKATWESKLCGIDFKVYIDGVFAEKARLDNGKVPPPHQLHTETFVMAAFNHKHTVAEISDQERARRDFFSGPGRHRHPSDDPTWSFAYERIFETKDFSNAEYDLAYLQQSALYHGQVDEELKEQLLRFNMIDGAL